MSGPIDMIGEWSEEERMERLSQLSQMGGVERTPAARDLTEVEEKSHQTGLSALSEIESPSSSDRMDPDRLTDIPPHADRVSQVAEEAGIPLEKKAEPRLVYEALRAGLAAEKNNEAKIVAVEKDIRKNLDLIKDLQALSTKIAQLGLDRDSYEITPEIREIVQRIKEKGIELPITGDQNVSRDQIDAVKFQISSITEKLNTEIRVDFTKIQTLSQLISSIIDILKRINQENSQALHSIIGNQRR